MPRKVLPLSDTKIKKSKPKDKVYYLRDGNGLMLQINPSGSKIWLFDYIHPITKKRSTYTIGLTLM
jgi:hemolysin-activating ACP:hemolysin acyltransferase